MSIVDCTGKNARIQALPLYPGLDLSIVCKAPIPNSYVEWLAPRFQRLPFMNTITRNPVTGDMAEAGGPLRCWVAERGEWKHAAVRNQCNSFCPLAWPGWLRDFAHDARRAACRELGGLEGARYNACMVQWVHSPGPGERVPLCMGADADAWDMPGHRVMHVVLAVNGAPLIEWSAERAAVFRLSPLAIVWGGDAKTEREWDMQWVGEQGGPTHLFMCSFSRVDPTGQERQAALKPPTVLKAALERQRVVYPYMEQ